VESTVRLTGLRDRYDWLLLRTVVALGYLGWIAYSVVFMVRAYTVWDDAARPRLGERTPPTGTALGAKHAWQAGGLGVFALLAVYLALVQAPLLYYVYVAFPVYFWTGVLADHPVWRAPLRYHWRHGSLVRVAVVVAVFVLALEVLVASYHERDILTGLFWLLAVWPLTWPPVARRSLRWLGIAWAAWCAALGVFTHLPVVSDQHPLLVYVGRDPGARPRASH
jgi:GPI ethanolamine phosphate transferase 1